jgi:O-antigen/teichoic acid export membrane protein
LALLISSLSLSGLLWAFSGPISSAQGFGAHPEYVLYLAGIMGFDAIAALPFAKLRQEGKSLRYAMIRLLGIGVNIGATLVFYLVLKKSGVGYVFLANLMGSGIMLLTLLPGAIPRWGLEVKRLRTMLSYGLPLLIAGLAGMVNESLSRLALDDFLPGTETARKAALGIFGSNYKLAVLMTLFTQTFRMAAEPFFFEQAKNKDAPETYARVHTVFTLLGLGIVLTVGLFLDVFKRLADERYHDDFEVVPVLLMANLLLGMYYNLTIWYKLTGNTKYGARLSVIGAVITFGGTALLVPIIGVLGAAVSTLLCYLVMALLCYSAGQKKYPIPYQVGPLGWAMGLATLVLIPPYVLPVLNLGLETEGQRLIYGCFALAVFFTTQWRY